MLLLERQKQWHDDGMFFYYERKVPKVTNYNAQRFEREVGQGQTRNGISLHWFLQ